MGQPHLLAKVRHLTRNNRLGWLWVGWDEDLGMVNSSFDGDEFCKTGISLLVEIPQESR